MGLNRDLAPCWLHPRDREDAAEKSQPEWSPCGTRCQGGTMSSPLGLGRGVTLELTPQEGASTPELLV